MKEWIKNINDDEMSSLLKDESFYDEMPAEFDSKLLWQINTYPQKLKAEKEEQTFFRKLQPYRFKIAAASLAALLIIPVLLYVVTVVLPQNSGVMLSRALLTSDDVSITVNDVSKPFSLNNEIPEGAIIATADQAICRTHIGEKAIVLLKENTRARFTDLKSSKFSGIRLDLEEGDIYLKVRKDKNDPPFSVYTEFAVITVVGTEFSVKTSPGKTLEVNVNEGIVKVKPLLNNKKPLFLREGDAVSIDAFRIIKQKSNDAIAKNFDTLNFKDITDTLQQARLKVRNDLTEVSLKINDKFITGFHNDLNMNIPEGEYTLVIEKPGFEKFQKAIKIKAGQEYFIDTELTRIEEREKEESSPVISIKEEKPEQKETISGFKKIYQYENPSDPSNNRISGIIESKGTVIVQTNVSLLCFNNKNKLLWNKNFGKKEGMFFMSIPQVFNNKVYISSINKKVAVLNALTGNKTAILDTDGIINFGYTMTTINDRFIFPLSSGLYTLNTDGKSLDQFIQFRNPVTPVKAGNDIIVASYVDKALALYSNSGEKQWDAALHNRIFASPIFTGKSIIVGDTKGIVYQLSMKGKILKQAEVAAGFTSKPQLYNNAIYTLLDDGGLYKIDVNDLSAEKMITVDATPGETKDYLFKKIVIFDNKLFIGNDTGELIIYNLDDDIVEKNIKLTDAKITSSIYKVSNYYYIGSETGELFSLY